MAETRELYVTYSIASPSGVGCGRNTVTLSSDTRLPEKLSMADIRRIEEGQLQTVRESAPDATGIHLTWWTEIRSEPSP